jgi:hypothetical protein
VAKVRGFSYNVKDDSPDSAVDVCLAKKKVPQTLFETRIFFFCKEHINPTTGPEMNVSASCLQVTTAKPLTKLGGEATM